MAALKRCGGLIVSFFGISCVCPFSWARCSRNLFFVNKVTHTAIIHNLIIVLMDIRQSDWGFAGDKGSVGTRVRLDADMIPQCSSSTNLPPVITQKWKD